MSASNDITFLLPTFAVALPILTDRKKQGDWGYPDNRTDQQMVVRSLRVRFRELITARENPLTLRDGFGEAILEFFEPALLNSR
ncbi:hypothetical protein ACH2GM_006218 [Pseudomonas aeruginosa]|jgi:hypothetical protein|uniref:hypothetical protein n=1 Tax=Pseudomonas TaxID=286 RepID=UPI0015F81FAC|nr:MULTISPECIES: hypothetical protein [Pseudomonas]EKT8672219.1 hypothetical protein [Pseudomonas aeruginosa]MBA6127748.1 hypothetical protein [Pseudomonas juntendi]MCE0940472.1 hypothetical protein [Pseudomonas kurunegalensis]